MSESGRKNLLLAIFRLITEDQMIVARDSANSDVIVISTQPLPCILSFR